jgi:hypothetical protein
MRSLQPSKENILNILHFKNLKLLNFFVGHFCHLFDLIESGSKTLVACLFFSLKASNHITRQYRNQHFNSGFACTAFTRPPFMGRNLLPEKSKTFLLSSSLGDLLLLLLLLLLPDKRGWDSSRLPPPPPPPAPVRRVMSILDSRNLARWLREPPGNL